MIILFIFLSIKKYIYYKINLIYLLKKNIRFHNRYNKLIINILLIHYIYIIIS